MSAHFQFKFHLQLLPEKTLGMLDSLESESAGGGLWPVEFAGMRSSCVEVLLPFLCTFVG